MSGPPGSGAVQAAVVPVGLGMGRGVQLADGNVLNLYLEPPYAVVQSGLGQPGFQVFAGFNAQLPPERGPWAAVLPVHLSPEDGSIIGEKS